MCATSRSVRSGSEQAVLSSGRVCARLLLVAFSSVKEFPVLFAAHA